MTWFWQIQGLSILLLAAGLVILGCEFRPRVVFALTILLLGVLVSLMGVLLLWAPR